MIEMSGDREAGGDCCCGCCGRCRRRRHHHRHRRTWEMYSLHHYDSGCGCSRSAIDTTSSFSPTVFMMRMWCWIITWIMASLTSSSCLSLCTAFLHHNQQLSPFRTNHRRHHHQRQHHQYYVKQSSTTAILTATTTAVASSNNSKQHNEQQPTQIILDPRSLAVFSLLESRRRHSKPKAANNNSTATGRRESQQQQQSQRQFSVRVLENNKSFLQMEPRDKAFARLLLSTVERREGQIEKVISSFMKKKKTKNGNVNVNDGRRRESRDRDRPADQLCDSALKVGAAQLLFLDVPKYAVIQETVEVLKKHPTIHVPPPKIKFVNAVLRSIDRDGHDRLMNSTSVLDNVDHWLCQQWIDTYGLETTQLIIETAMSQSPIFLSINHRDQIPSSSSEEEERQTKLHEIQRLFSSHSTSTSGDRGWNEMMFNEDDSNSVTSDNSDDSISELLPHGSLRVPTDIFGSVISKWPMYDEGEWWVQDAAASIPALALENALLSKAAGTSSSNRSSRNLLENMHVVDLCSAPGGKTAQLCSMGFGTVTAVEISKKRSRVLEQNLQRLGMMQESRQDDDGDDDNIDSGASSSGRAGCCCQIVIQDGCTWTPEETSSTVTPSIDGVLVDAPCSASGVASRQPDVLRKCFKDVLPDLLQTQRQLAAHAADNIIQPGGILVYATCSLLKQEGEDQAEWLLGRRDDGKEVGKVAQLETIPFEKGEIPGFDQAIDKNGWLRIVPGTLAGSLAHVDGFFVARMRRIK
jgi:16S rRNA (cytosine967-C5)-methyltransferase